MKLNNLQKAKELIQSIKELEEERSYIQRKDVKWIGLAVTGINNIYCDDSSWRKHLSPNGPERTAMKQHTELYRKYMLKIMDEAHENLIKQVEAL